MERSKLKTKNHITKKPFLPFCFLKVFGYSLEENSRMTVLNLNSPAEDETTAGSSSLSSNNDFLDEVQIFLASFKFRFGDASGESSRRDIIQAIHYTPEIDCFITVALKGAVTVWNNRLKLQSCTFLKVILRFIPNGLFLNLIK